MLGLRTKPVSYPNQNPNAGKNIPPVDLIITNVYTWLILMSIEIGRCEVYTCIHTCDGQIYRRTEFYMIIVHGDLGRFRSKSVIFPLSTPKICTTPFQVLNSEVRSDAQTRLQSPESEAGSQSFFRMAFPLLYFLDSGFSMFFPHLRVVRFYVSCRRPPLLTLPPPPRPPPPDLNRKCRMAVLVFPAGPQPPAPDGSVLRQTSTASSGWQCSPPASDGSVLRRTSTASSGWQCIPGRTSTASSAWHCSPPDLNHELRLAVFPAGGQCPLPDLNRELRLAASAAGDRIRMSKDVPE